MKLKKLNSHERDSRIEFDEEPHEYYIDGSNEKIISVTTFIHDFFPKFDADLIIDKMMNSSRWENSKYYGMTKDEIKDLWERTGKESSDMGTILHKSIEDFYNDLECDNSSHEWNLFENFSKDHLSLEPFRTEWEVFDEDLLLAGSIDMCFRNDSGKICIYDWKRSKEIKEQNDFEEGFYPLNHLPNSNYWHYSLQLNIYKAILEKKYGLEVDDMYLVRLHPNCLNYEKIKVFDMSDEVDKLFEERLKQIGALCK